MHEQISQYLEDQGFPPNTLKDWTCKVFQRNGVDSLITITNGCEIHMASMTERKALCRKNIREALAPILDEFGMATTRFPIGETDHSLVKRLGFFHTWSDNNYSYWALTDMPYQKATQ